MRALTDAARLAALMRALGREAHAPGRVWFTGGVSALLLGFRASTVDVDLSLDAGAEALLDAMPRLKEQLEVNIELARPSDFVPALPGWEERSQFIAREGPIDFHHYDFYGQVLSKIERDHVLDRSDVAAFVAAGLVEPFKLLDLFTRVENELRRYPAIDAAKLRARVAAFAAGS